MSGVKSNRTGLVAVVTMILVAATIYWFVSSNRTRPPAAPAVAEESKGVKPLEAPSAKLDLEPNKPVSIAPEPEPIRPRPAPLNNSDEATRKDLLSLSTDSALAKWLVPDAVIRKWVTAVSAAASGNLVNKNRPFTNLPGTLKTKVLSVSDTGAKVYQLSADNYLRYQQPVRLMALVNNAQAVALYQFWYPRLAQAYAELGIHDKHFHQVLLQAIDRALAAPEPKQPIKLIRPSVYYRFADKKLENLSGIDKLMIRIGPSNAARVKQKLRELKISLEKIQPQPQ